MSNVIEMVDEALAVKASIDFFTLSIVVAFEKKETKLVKVSNDRGTMTAQLSDLLDAGGRPVGLLGSARDVTDKRIVTFYPKIFQEYADDESIHHFFEGLMRSVEKAVRAQGAKVLPGPGDPKKN